MRTETTTTRTLYKLAELSDTAREHALEELRDLNVRDFEWWDAVYDDAKQCAAILGIEIRDIWFSGFWSQGDGACFEGYYSYAPGSVKAIRQHAPQDTELHAIAERLRDVQRATFYTATASVKHRGHYYHSGCMAVDASADKGTLDWEELGDTLRAFADWIYARLEAEHDYLTSEEVVRESIEADDYEFTEAGDLA